MAEKESSGDKGFLFFFFGGIFIFWVLTGAGEGSWLFRNATSTDERASSTSERQRYLEDTATTSVNFGVQRE